jgi:RecA/RadA recombinase
MDNLLNSWKWNFDSVGFLGRKGVGKTYLTKQLIGYAQQAKPHAAKPNDIWILDAKNQYANHGYVYEAGINEYNAEMLDKFLHAVYKEHDKLAVTDDLDLFIKAQRESDYLANFLINAGSGRHIGLLWQSKRLANLDTRLLTESHYIIVGHGCHPNDWPKLEQAGFDTPLYRREIYGKDEHEQKIEGFVLDEHKYIQLNTFTHENTVIKGFA